MIELSDIIKTVLAVLAIFLMAGMLWLIVVLYNRAKVLQTVLSVPTDDFSGITTTPAVGSTAPIYYSQSAYDPRYSYGDTYNYDPRYTYNPYQNRYTYTQPQYYNNGFYYPTTYASAN